MIMGDMCSRGCKFCNVETGKPFELDSKEPQNVAEAIKDWDLRYVVITSVCRDDLPDEGSEHFAKTIESSEEILQTGKDLRDVNVDMITLGQYMQPSKSHLPVKEFVTPEMFYKLKLDLKKLEFLHVESGPFVRSSFRASDIIDLITMKTTKEN
jgi:lipoate synthase